MMSGLSVCLFVLVGYLGSLGPYVSWIVGTLCILDRRDPMCLGLSGAYVPWIAGSLCVLVGLEPSCPKLLMVWFLEVLEDPFLCLPL